MEITRISDSLTLAMFPDAEFWSAGIRNPPTMLPLYLDRTAAVAVKDVTEHEAEIDLIDTLTTGTPERDRRIQISVCRTAQTFRKRTRPHTAHIL